ncbi:MAG: DUF4982 domain-containing protein [Acidobacteria bacterium]|nr:DUF4982 domain-containing protein [Acidobacteriota bacterium]
MKNELLKFFFSALFIGGMVAAAAAQRETVSFNEGWRFQKDDPADAKGVLTLPVIREWIRATGNEFLLTPGAEKPARPSGNLGEAVAYTRAGFDDSAWRRLDLPHDWAIEGPFDKDWEGETGKRPYAGVGWYRKHFNVPATDRGRQIFIDFDGAMAYPVVWVNGRFVGGWGYGYASFRLDLTPYLKPGADNVIAVRLENPPESSRWYPGSGIYRNVRLVKTAPVHVAGWGTFVTMENIAADADVDLTARVQNDSNASVRISVTHKIYELSKTDAKSAKPVAVSKPVEATIAPLSTKSVPDAVVTVPNAKLWSVDAPNRYAAVTEIRQNGRLVDVYETPFGIRGIKWSATEGLLLNGKRLYLQGVCDHHDLGALGSALNYRALERQLEILKEMGVNAIRTSHNPPAPELLELADKMGFVVMDEAFDEWVQGKRPNGYNQLFKDWHEKDLRAQIRRDRNHPSVFVWSTGNEIWEQRPKDHPVSTMLAKIVREEDPTRLVTAGANGTESGYNGFQKTVDVFGYNYKPHQYEKFRKENPSIPLFASETASTISSRGEYFFPVVEDKSKGMADFQMSSYDLYAPPWATTPDTEFAGQDKNPFVAGEFVWTGFDYLGEPTPYDTQVRFLPTFTDPQRQAAAAEEFKNTGKVKTPSRSSYFGIVDLCGFKKDRFYIYQARWRPDLPMAHILPHWNWPERLGEVTPVHVYTSGDEAELFLNGKSLGRKKRGQYEYRLRWDDVRYEPGELKVVAYKNGKKWAEDTVRTTGAAAAVAMSADRSSVRADGRDLVFVTVRITDANGLMVPRSHNEVRFSIAGAGEIVATDNGDATDLTPFQSTTRQAYNGMALVIVRPLKGKGGKITVKAESDGLKAASVSVTSR